MHLHLWRMIDAKTCRLKPILKLLVKIMVGILLSNNDSGSVFCYPSPRGAFQFSFFHVLPPSLPPFFWGGWGWIDHALAPTWCYKNMSDSSSLGVGIASSPGCSFTRRQTWQWTRECDLVIVKFTSRGARYALRLTRSTVRPVINISNRIPRSSKICNFHLWNFCFRDNVNFAESFALLLFFHLQ